MSTSREQILNRLGLEYFITELYKNHPKISGGSIAIVLDLPQSTVRKAKMRLGIKARFAGGIHRHDGYKIVRAFEPEKKIELTG